MKFINKMLCLTLLFAIGSATAKRRGAATPASSKAKAQPAPRTQAPAQGSTLKQLRDNALRTNPLNNQNLFDNNYVDRMAADLKQAGLGSDALEMILGAAAAKYVKLTGNDADDLGILNSINQQIANASNW
jgi:hypothetical protein